MPEWSNEMKMSNLYKVKNSHENNCGKSVVNFYLFVDYLTLHILWVLKYVY